MKFLALFVLGLITLVVGRPETANKEGKEEDGALVRSRSSTANPTDRNPVLEYLLTPAHLRNQIPHGGRREINFLQLLTPTTSSPPKLKPRIITAPPKTKPKYQRDPNKSPYENFNGFILAGKKPEDNLVESQSLAISESVKIDNGTLTKVDILPAVATVIRTYDENGTLRSSLTRYEHAGQSITQPKENADVSAQTRQQISWPYAGYFPILIKDPFLTLFHTLAAGNSFSLTSVVEYGPDADICARETKQQHDQHSTTSPSSSSRDLLRAMETSTESEKLTGDVRKLITSPERTSRRVREVAIDTLPEYVARFYDSQDYEKPSFERKSTRLTVNDPEKGLATIRLDNPETERNNFYQPEEILRRANIANLVLPPLSTIVLPPFRNYDKKKPKPDKEDNSEEENVGEQEETSESSGGSDSVAINPPPEGSSVAEAKPVGLAIAGPGGVASSKPVAQAIVGPGGLAIARPVATAIAGVDVEGGVPIGSQKKPQKKKPKQEYDNDPDTELQYVGGLTGLIGNPKPKHTPPQTNYIGGLRGVVGNPIPKFEAPAATSRQVQYKVGYNDGKYGFLPYFLPSTATFSQDQGRTLEGRMDAQKPTYFHGMIGSNSPNFPASAYPLIYYS